MLLNRDNFIHLNYGYHGKRYTTLDYRNGNALFDIRNFDDHDYFFIEFIHSQCLDDFPLDKLIPNDILERIRTDNSTFLFLSNTHEAFHSIVDTLYKHLLKSEIPLHKVILMNESRDLHLEVDRVAKEYNTIPIRTEWSLIFQNGMRIQTFNHIEEIPRTLEHKDYPKKFLNFNRRWRYHRPLVVALLVANNLLDKGYISLGDSDDNNNWQTMFWWLEEYAKYDQELSDVLANNKERIMSTPPLYLDQDNLKINWVENSISTNYLYENSLFSIVNETNFFTDKNKPITKSVTEGSRFLSEKTFKPIANRHPFVMVSVPNMLDTLKELGYKTFHPYIDETYDTIIDDIQRLKHIINEVNRLSNMTVEEEYKFIENIKPIVEHNLRTLLKQEQFVYKTL